MAEKMLAADDERRKPGRPAKVLIAPGMPFGRWPVMEKSPEKRASWRCRCKCGTVKDVKCTYLATGTSQSCGCLRSEMASAGRFVSKKPMKKREYHGGCGTPEYSVWMGLIQRCENPNAHNYAYYGGVGVTVCRRWRQSFAAFLADMGPRPSPKHTIERRDEKRGYELGNCDWATHEVQMNHVRSNVTITARGETLTVAQWARKTALGRGTIRSRLLRGLAGDDALQPVACRKEPPR